jgi:hypothetical protein
MSAIAALPVGIGEWQMPDAVQPLAALTELSGLTSLRHLVLDVGPPAAAYDINSMVDNTVRGGVWSS